MKPQSPGLTRRALAGLVAIPGALASKAEAQEQASPNQAPADSRLSAGRARFRNAARALFAVKFARAVEPATRFEA
jgi:hypothetical protein